MTAQTIQKRAKHAGSLFVCLCVLIFLGSIPPASGQTNWTKYYNFIPDSTDTTSTNGRIAVGTPGQGDATNVHYFAMIKDDNLYKIWYSGEVVVNVSRGYYATSPDGLTWTKYDNNTPANSDTTNTNGRLGLGNNGRGDDARILIGTVIKDGADDYKMWYSGYDEAVWRIYYATSTDGVAWVKYDNTIPDVSDGVCTNGKIALGNSGTGDDAAVFTPAVIKDGGVYKMWYGGWDGVSANYRIYYATSTNGLTWTKFNNTAPTNSDTVSTDGRLGLGTDGTKGDNVGLFSPHVLKDRGTYHMWYSAFGGPNRIYYATSPDGLTWTKLNNIIPANSDTTSTDGRIPLGSASRGDAQHAYAPRVVIAEDMYKMWYTGRAYEVHRLYHATSPRLAAGTIITVR